MAVQIANCYAYNVKRLSAMPPPVMVGGSNAYAVFPGAGMAAYEGEQVYVLASSSANALAVLQAQYGTDLGPVTGGATLVPGALTTMTGS